MKVLVFDIEADYAHFKSYEATRGNYSFPFPPRTALLGLIAGILGIQRNEYWEYDNPLRYTKIALEVVNPIQRYGLKVNYTRTRETTSLGKSTDRISFHFPDNPTDPEMRGYITQVRLDLLKNVYYRIYLPITDKILQQFSEKLQNRQYTYPPYLGHANLLANVSYIGMIEGEIIHPTESIPTAGIIPVSSLEKREPVVSAGMFNIIYNVPYSQKIESREKRFDGSYSLITKTDGIDNFLFQTTSLNPIKLLFNSSAKVFRVNLRQDPSLNLKSPWNDLNLENRVIVSLPVSSKNGHLD